MISCQQMDVYRAPIGQEKKGQYPEKFRNDINVRFWGALLALRFKNYDN